MNFSEWSEGPAQLRFENGSRIYVIPTAGAKPIKVVFEDDYDMHQVRGGPGNPPLLRWRHDDAFVYGGVQYLWEPLEYDYAVNSSDIEGLL